MVPNKILELFHKAFHSSPVHPITHPPEVKIKINFLFSVKLSLASSVTEGTATGITKMQMTYSTIKLVYTFISCTLPAAVCVRNRIHRTTVIHKRAANQCKKDTVRHNTMCFRTMLCGVGQSMWRWMMRTVRY